MISSSYLYTMYQTLVISLVLLLPPLLLLIITRRNNKSSLPPSPPTLPLVGNLHQLGSLPHRSLATLADKYGPLMYLQLGQVPALVVSSAEMAREIMKTHDVIIASRPRTKTTKLIMKGNQDVAFTPYGEYWKQARKLCVTHLLSAKMVQSFKSVREELVHTMIDKINRAAASLMGSVNMSEAMSAFVTNIMCRAVMGKAAQDYAMLEIVQETSFLLGAFHVADFFPVIGSLDVFSLDRRAKKNGKIWDEVLDEVLDGHANRSDGGDGGGDRDQQRKHRDFVDVLLSLGKDADIDFNFTRDNIKAILFNMFGAGTETTYIALEWSVTELIRNPEAMKKLQEEVRSVACDKRMLREEELSKMTYLKAVIKEALRLHPPVPLLPREVSEDCKFAGYRVSKGTRVFINAWAIGRDPKNWDEPNLFRPERFLDGKVDYKGTDYQFLPFGSGRRICPGINFAVSTLELALANLVRWFDYELPGKIMTDDVDMAEAPGVGARKREPLHLDAKVFSFEQD